MRRYKKVLKISPFAFLDLGARLNTYKKHPGSQRVGVVLKADSDSGSEAGMTFHYFFKNSLMPAAARRPSPMARITVAAPSTMSPPA